MKRILTLTAAGLLAVACSGGPTGLNHQASVDPDAVYSLNLGPEVTAILDSANDPETPFLVGEAWECQVGEDLFNRADAIADRIEKDLPDLVEIRQTRLIPTIGEPSTRDLPFTGACVDFTEQLIKSLIDRGFPYTLNYQRIETDVTVSMALDGYPILPMRLMVCRAELTPDLVEFPPPE
jgi:hypothetical protein